MIYKIFRVLANIAIRVFYGKIEVDGIENIPKNVPILIASNHPNGFLEPIIMACLFPRPLHFMVRGDVFRKKWLKPILIQTNQIPIFRFKDGFSELRKNDSSLQIAYEALDRGAAIILFIEGGTINIKKLRPFQKGLARMASDYLAKENSRDDLMILPVAINFVSPFVLRSRVNLNIGKALTAREYFHNGEPKPVEVKKMTDDLYSRIKPMAYHVSDDSRQPTLNKTLKWVEGLIPLPFFPGVNFQKTNWSTFKATSNMIDQMDEKQFSEFKKGIDNLGAVSAQMVKRSNSNYFLNYLLSIVLLIPAMVGLVMNIIPGLMAQHLAKTKLDESNTVFMASIILSSGVGFYVVYYFWVIVGLSFFFGLKALAFLLAYPLGIIFLWWKNVFRSSFLKGKYQLTDDQKNRLIALFADNNVTIPKT